MLNFSGQILVKLTRNLHFCRRFGWTSVLAMPKYINANGIVEFQSVISQQKDEEDVFVLFCGGIDESTGKSWCSDCVKGR